MVFVWSHSVGVVAGTEVIGGGGCAEAEVGGLQNLVSLTWESTKYRSGQQSHNKTADQ